MSSDCLLWVDGPYKTVAQFIKEAETRGCCRRMKSWPSWVKPGKTRVFLAHRNGHVRTDRGSIFGYFTLGGVAIPPPGGKSSPDKPKPEPQPEDDPPVHPPPGGGSPPGDEGYEIDPNQIKKESERDCGSRMGGAVYFVDALARNIDSTFGETFEKLKEGVSPGSEEFDEAIEEAFDEAVKRAGSRRAPRTAVPAMLKGRAHRRGSLVVFEQPYPSFQRLPQAAFRNLARIDGDELLKRIVAVYEGEGLEKGDPEKRDPIRFVRIPYYHTAPGKRKTKGQLVTDLAEEAQASKEFAAGLWGSLVKMITQELDERAWMTLRDVGTFRVVEVRGSTQVTFEPSEVLKGRLGAR